MKKFIAIILISLMTSITFTACNSGTEETSSTETASIAAESAAVSSEPGWDDSDRPIKGDFVALKRDIAVSSGGSMTFIMPFINIYGTEVTTSLVESPQHGKVTMVSSSTKITYRAKSGYKGIDTFTIGIIDETLNTSQVVVTAYVGVTREAGISINSESGSADCGPGGGTATAQISAKSAKNGNTVRYMLAPNEGLTHGAATVSDTGLITYTQTSDIKYKDLVKVIVFDDDQSCAVYNLTINKNSPA